MNKPFDPAELLRNLSTQPGVYRMYNDEQQVIYVGKAKNLKKRVSSYFRKDVGSVKTAALVKQIANFDVTVTHTETEAFILENNYIKKYQPKYNVLLRDDKSYPFIFLSAHKHPRLSLHRGSRKLNGQYFGPYPSANAARESLRLMQKIIPVRQCEDSYYKARSRPCLQYQLKRCSAPCVPGKVSDEEYQEQVKYVEMFLTGKGYKVIDQLVAKMENASNQLEFEKAATIRDQITALRTVQEQQWVSGNQEEMDIIGFARGQGIVCIYVLYIRQNKIQGSKSFFPKVPDTSENQEAVQAFLMQHYLEGQQNIPKQLVLPFKLDESIGVEQALSSQQGRNVKLLSAVRTERKKYLDLANTNAKTALTARNNEKMSIQKRFNELENTLELDLEIKRMECFDISHTSGQQTVASCVVFGREGPIKAEYRRFNIEGITPGDDFAAMAQVVKRRYDKVTEGANIPDIILIDGGKGQLAQAERYFEEKQLNKMPLLIGVAKGVSRKHGLETLILAGNHEQISLSPDSSALHLIQHIRDESHRFAIAGHRAKRGKVKTVSKLQGIPGVGAKRRQTLLKHLGGLQEVIKSSAEELAKVPGISKELAETIVNHLRSH